MRNKIKQVRVSIDIKLLNEIKEKSLSTLINKLLEEYINKNKKY